MNQVLSILYPLGITIIIEYAIIQLLMRKKFVLLQVILINVLTNPGINFLYRHLIYDTLLESNEIQWIIAFCEVAVFVVEGILFHFILKIKWSKAMGYSFVANLCSYLASFIL